MEPDVDENIAYFRDSFSSVHVDWRKHGLVTPVKTQVVDKIKMIFCKTTYCGLSV